MSEQNLLAGSANLTERFAALQAAGAAPSEIYARARQEGFPKIEAIRLLRQLFGLSLQEAREVTWKVEGRPENILPKIGSYDDLTAALKSELGYCACAGDILITLRDFLQLIQYRTEATKDAAEFSRLSRLVESRLCPPGSSALLADAAAWFVFALEQKGFIWHGFRLTDLWINDKGRALLKSLQEFPPPDAPPREP